MTTPAPVEVRRLRADERDAAVTLVVDAFRADPQVRWWFPDDATYDDVAGRFFGVLLDLRLAGGEVWTAGGGAVALWNPPGGNLLGPQESARRYGDVVAALPAPCAERVAALDEAVGAVLPGQAHWYLGVLATAVGRQGRGLASAVVAPVLAAADRAGLPAVLETGKEGNLGFYARHGFEPAEHVRVPGAPSVWVLVRAPR